jgi:hypothetical protein
VEAGAGVAGRVWIITWCAGEQWTRVALLFIATFGDGRIRHAGADWKCWKLVSGCPVGLH